MCTVVCAPAHARMRSLTRPLMKNVWDTQLLYVLCDSSGLALGFWVQTQFGTSGKLTVRERMVFYRLLPYRLFEKRCGPFVRGLQPKRFLLLSCLIFTNSNLRNFACWRSVFAALAPQLSAKILTHPAHPGHDKTGPADAASTPCMLSALTLVLHVQLPRPQRGLEVL